MRAFQSLWVDISTALVTGTPDSIADKAFTTHIIGRDARDKIFDLGQNLEKKGVLLRAVEAQIELQPNVYYQFLDILSEDPSKRHICQKMREKCGKNQLCITSIHFITYLY